MRNLFTLFNRAAAADSADKADPSPGGAVEVERRIEQHNTCEARPFTWRADPDKIIAARN